MPITAPQPIANQVGPNGIQPYANQINFGQLFGRVAMYAPHCSITAVQNICNNVVRRIYDRRNWYGLYRRGQIVSPGYYSTGTIALVAGSASVQGTNTAWTALLVGQQLRVGFTAPIYTVIAVDPVHQVLTIEMPWGLPSVSSTGYFISQMYYSIPNIKFFYSVKNLQLYYRLWTNVPQSLLENWDPSRMQLMFPRVLASMPPDPSGNYQFELWPAPNTAQSFPYLSYCTIPNLVNDTDNFPPFIRSDVIELGAIAEVLLWRPKNNPAYSESMCLQVSKDFNSRFEIELLHAAEADEALMRQDVISREEQTPYCGIDWTTGSFLGVGGGATLAAMSAVESDW